VEKEKKEKKELEERKKGEGEEILHETSVEEPFIRKTKDSWSRQTLLVVWIRREIIKALG